MLTALSIRNIVLIEALALDFAGGLGVLTGETGAGKSILLDALGLAPRLAPAPVLERQADRRSDEWVDRYRADAEREGLPL